MLIGVLALMLAGGVMAEPSPAPSPPPPPVAEPAADEPAPASSSIVPEEALPPGTPTIPLAQAVATALERNFTVLNSADAVATSRLREGVTRAQFYPKVTPRYQRSADDALFGLDATQKLPWTGGSVTAAALMRSTFEGATGPDVSPFPRTSDLRLVLTQPLLRGFGPNAAFYDLRLSRRTREGQERQYELGRQRLAVDVTRSYYQVIQQRQLLAVARQSLDRSESLRRASTARLEVGLVSKLDVYRAELRPRRPRNRWCARRRRWTRSWSASAPSSACRLRIPCSRKRWSCPKTSPTTTSSRWRSSPSARSRTAST
jgi:outer membrane protein TolC